MIHWYLINKNKIWFSETWVCTRTVLQINVYPHSINNHQTRNSSGTWTFNYNLKIGIWAYSTLKIHSSLTRIKIGNEKSNTFNTKASSYLPDKKPCWSGQYRNMMSLKIPYIFHENISVLKMYWSQNLNITWLFARMVHVPSTGYSDISICFTITPLGSVSFSHLLTRFPSPSYIIW